MAGRHPGRRRQQRGRPVISDTQGAIGYVDLSDANASDLTFANVQNKAGNFVAPTLEATTAAAESVTINDDLTFFTGWADGDDAYPIAAQTWIIAYTKQADADKAEALQGFLTYLLTDGQALAQELDYAPLPAAIRRRRRWPTSPRSAPDPTRCDRREGRCPPDLAAGSRPAPTHRTNARPTRRPRARRPPPPTDELRRDLRERGSSADRMFRWLTLAGRRRSILVILALIA